MKPTSFFAAALVTSSMFLPGLASATAALTFNPLAPNTGCTDLNAGACGAVGTTAQFNTDNAIIQYSGRLDIAKSFANGGGISVGGTTWNESGNFKFENFKLLGVTQTSGVNRGQGGDYDLYAKFTSGGTGGWLTGANFVTTGVSFLNVTLYASPSSGSSQVLGTASSGIDATGGIISFGTEDFILGTSSIIFDSTNFGSANISGGSGGTATTSLLALLDFSAAAGTTGINGYFKEPDPFVITIGSQAGSNANQSTWTTLGSGVRISTLITNPGGGSLAFTAVPEPSSLALVGIALLAIGAVRPRKDRTPA